MNLQQDPRSTNVDALTGLSIHLCTHGGCGRDAQITHRYDWAILPFWTIIPFSARIVNRINTIRLGEEPEPWDWVGIDYTGQRWCKDCIERKPVPDRVWGHPPIAFDGITIPFWVYMDKAGARWTNPLRFMYRAVVWLRASRNWSGIGESYPIEGITKAEHKALREEVNA